MDKTLRSNKKIKEFEIIKLQSEIEDINVILGGWDYMTKSEILGMGNIENGLAVLDTNKTMKCSLKVRDGKLYIDGHEGGCDRTGYNWTRLRVKK